MSSNKRAKEALIRLYGKECFIEKLHLRPDTERKYTGKAQYHRMKQLTYHHIEMKKDGGKATIENGALLSAENHEWFNRQSKEKQRQMNDMFQEYKRKIDYGIAVAQLTTQGIKQAEAIEVEPTEEVIEIPVYETTLEEQKAFEEYKRKRNQKVLNKFKGEER